MQVHTWVGCAVQEPPKSSIPGGSSKLDACNVWHTYHKRTPGEPQVHVEEIRVSMALSEPA